MKKGDYRYYLDRFPIIQVILDDKTAHEIYQLVETREITDDWTRVRSYWMIIEDCQVQDVRFDTALYPGRELTDLLHKAGVEKIRLFGSLQRTPYDLNAQKLIAVAVAFKKVQTKFFSLPCLCELAIKEFPLF